MEVLRKASVEEFSKYFEPRLLHIAEAIYFLEENGNVIGSVIVKRKSRIYTIIKFCILPKKQNQGYGKLLYSEMRKFAKENGAIEIIVNCENKQVHGFCKKMGLKRLKGEEKYLEII